MRRRWVSEKEWETGEKYRVLEKSNIIIKSEPKIEELYKWYPIVDEGEYWTDYDLLDYPDWEEKYGNREKIATILTNGKAIYTQKDSKPGWSTMAKEGNWKYMRVKID